MGGRLNEERNSSGWWWRSGCEVKICAAISARTIQLETPIPASMQGPASPTQCTDGRETEEGSWEKKVRYLWTRPGLLAAS
jgi:hypothetical protein